LALFVVNRQRAGLPARSTLEIGSSVSILTGRELDFLASLRTSWKRLYLSEVARLLTEDDTCADRPKALVTPQPAFGSGSV
jgi:hypothetical protein